MRINIRQRVVLVLGAVAFGFAALEYLGNPYDPNLGTLLISWTAVALVTISLTVGLKD